MGLLRRLDAYWFGYGSPTALGLIRILVGLVSFLSLLITAGGFLDWFTERGFVTQVSAHRYMGPIAPGGGIPFEVPRLNLLGGVTDERLSVALYAVIVLSAITTSLGLWTRFSTIVLAIGTVSLHHRNGFILHGGDSVLRIAALYLAISPCGKACSLDRLIGLWQGRIQPHPPLVSLWPQRLIAYNVALIYFTSVWHKLHGAQWLDGTAAWYPVRLAEFKRFPVPQFMVEMPFVKIATYGTLVVEAALGTLVFYRPTRKWALLAGLLMHGTIEYSMNIPLFAFSICSLYVAFYDGEEIAAWARRLGGRLALHRLYVWLPIGKRLNPAASAALDAADPLGLVDYREGRDTNWKATGPAGKAESVFSGSMARSLGAWPLAIVPGLWRRLLDRSLAPAEDAS